MADLASVDELATLLGLTETEQDTAEDLLTLLLDSAEAVFESQVDRLERPFQAAQSGRVEIHEGIGSTKLGLDYPIGTVTAIALGLDVAAPTETLSPADATKVVWRAGQRTLTRTDGGVWTSQGSALLSWARGGPLVPDEFDTLPGYVKVTYDAADDLPADAKLAVLGLAALMYRQSGAEGVQSETLDNYSVTFAKASQVAETVPGWLPAVQRHRRLVAV